MNQYNVIERIPTISEYQRLRGLVGWGNKDVKAIEVGLQNSLFSVCVINQHEIIGCGRVVGDGGIYFYIQDIIVIADFQGKGIGKLIMDRVMNYLKMNAHSGAFIGLMAAPGVSKFYSRYGFIERSIDRPGMFQIF